MINIQIFFNDIENSIFIIFLFQFSFLIPLLLFFIFCRFFINLSKDRCWIIKRSAYLVMQIYYLFYFFFSLHYLAFLWIGTDNTKENLLVLLTPSFFRYYLQCLIKFWFLNVMSLLVVKSLYGISDIIQLFFFTWGLKEFIFYNCLLWKVQQVFLIVIQK